MSKKLFIGIDNGVSGSIASIGENTTFCLTPVTKVLSYTKKVANLNRLDYTEFKIKLLNILSSSKNITDVSEIIVGLERPMVNSARFQASISAVRCLEATLICLEELNLPYIYIDSKEWQKPLLPKGIKGAPELKKASLEIGNRLFPQFKEDKHKDRDSLLIAEYLRQTYA